MQNYILGGRWNNLTQMCVALFTVEIKKKKKKECWDANIGEKLFHRDKEQGKDVSSHHCFAALHLKS